MAVGIHDLLPVFMTVVAATLIMTGKHRWYERAEFLSVKEYLTRCAIVLMIIVGTLSSVTEEGPSALVLDQRLLTLVTLASTIAVDEILSVRTRPPAEAAAMTKQGAISSQTNLEGVQKRRQRKSRFTKGIEAAGKMAGVVTLAGCGAVALYFGFSGRSPPPPKFHETGYGRFTIGGASILSASACLYLACWRNAVKKGRKSG